MKDHPASGIRGASRSRAHFVRMREELRAKLRDYDFTHFITLASSHQLLGYRRMRDVLKEWDARVNRELNGPRWQQRPDERLVWFAFPEKMDVNPHWHLIAQVDPEIESSSRADRTNCLPRIGEKHWLNLVRQGTFDCQPIDSQRVIEYVTKATAEEDNFNSFVFFREVMNE